jgi:hypothetical protein
MGVAPIKMPQLGESVTEGTVDRWLKQEGDYVKRDEPLVEVVTDKVNAEVPSPFEGKLVAIRVAEGTTVAIGTEIAEMELAGAAPEAQRAAEEAVPETPAEAEPSTAVARSTAQETVAEASGGRARLSPAVRRLAEEHGIALRPRVAFATFEQLLEPTRRHLEDALRCRVVSLYSASELGICGWECSERRIHFVGVLPEVLRPDDAPCEPGEVGRLVLTSLKSRVMPLIRYEVGDLAVPPSGPCRCGRSTPYVERLEGRQMLQVRTRSGLERPAYPLMSYVDDLRCPEYQLVQDRPGALRLILLHGTAPPADAVEQLRRRVSGFLEEETELDVQADGDFVLTPAGKRNPFVQLSA